MSSNQGRVGQKLRTRRTILEATSVLISAGQRPTVTEAADAAGVSRRTAYRYFPSQAGLLAEAALEKLWPLMEAEIEEERKAGAEGGLQAQIVALVRKLQGLTLAHEQLMRTVIHATVLGPAQPMPKRGLRRVQWIEQAIEPLRARLPRTTYRRLVSALVLCVGADSAVALRDVRGLSAAQTIATSEWLALAALRAALAEAR